MNIFELKSEYAAILDAYSQGVDDAIEEATGEVIPLKDYLDKLDGEIKEKITNVALVIKNREAMKDALKNQVKILNDRIKKEDKRIAGAENYLRLATEEHNFEDKEGRFAITFKKNPPSVQIDKNAVIPTYYMRTKTTTEPDKKKLKEALQNGETFEGINLVQAIGMSIK